jgi:arsenate reductase
MIPTVLFACVHNAGRSQMAAAWFHELANPTRARAISAGTQPSERVHPTVRKVMTEAGIDLSRAEPRLLTDDIAREASFLVTMGCGDACPVVPGVPRQDWPLQEPKDKPIEEVRAIRDELRARVAMLVSEHGWGHGHGQPEQQRAGGNRE